MHLYDPEEQAAIDKVRNILKAATDQILECAEPLYDKKTDKIKALITKNAELRAENRLLDNALQDYGQHNLSCDSLACMSAPCNCGFEAALSGQTDLAATAPASTQGSEDAGQGGECGK